MSTVWRFHDMSVSFDLALERAIRVVGPKQRLSMKCMCNGRAGSIQDFAFLKYVVL